MSTETPDFMTLQEAADLVRVHHTTLRKAIHAGLLPASMPNGRSYRITREGIQQWLENTSTKPKSKKKGA